VQPGCISLPSRLRSPSAGSWEHTSQARIRSTVSPVVTFRNAAANRPGDGTRTVLGCPISAQTRFEHVAYRSPDGRREPCSEATSRQLPPSHTTPRITRGGSSPLIRITGPRGSASTASARIHSPRRSDKGRRSSVAHINLRYIVRNRPESHLELGIERVHDRQRLVLWLSPGIRPSGQARVAAIRLPPPRLPAMPPPSRMPKRERRRSRKRK
jgi:hypothetical protein